MSKSLYTTLDIQQGASADEIKKAYKRMARKFHPDLNKEADAEEKFKEVNAAYEVLSDPQKRAQYDQHGDSMFGGQNFHDFSRSQSGAGGNLDDILRQMFAGGGGMGGGGFSGGGFGGMGGMGTPDLDVEIRITVPFFVSIKGGKHSVTVENESFDIKIPAGINSGETMRVRGKGKSYHGQKGDLLIKVNVAGSHEYERDGDNLTKSFDISLKTALFGGKVAIHTLDKEVNLSVPAGTKPGQKFRLKEQGAMNRKTKVAGFLYLKANIIMPDMDTLDEDLKNMMQEKLPDLEA